MHNATRCAELKARFGPMIRAIVDAYTSRNRWPGKRKR
jgi:hypothetical protein